ncbi:MAG: YigZ family protein [Lachnospira sp.]|nr:YigZ family protein [Lachnospira sp.]
MKRIRVGGTGEIVEKKSRFIAQVFDVGTEEEATEYINNIKKKYWDARHNCWALVIGNNNELQRFSDDGEPGGTAGKPILEVLDRSGVRNCLIVVTRYFGGTLLGTGGLVRAYQASAKAGLEASSIMEVHSGKKVAVDINYNNVGKMQYICSELDIPVLATEYGADVHMELMVNDDIYGMFAKKVTESFSGTVEPEDMGQCDYGLVGREVAIL